jgi:translation initiation factor eIF-2B subunit beta
MAPNSTTRTPGFNSFLRSLPTDPIDNSTEYLISLLKRRQIKGPKPCALATAYLLRRVITLTRAADSTKLIDRVTQTGKRLIAANPKEPVIANIVRRVLGLIRDEEDEKRGGDFSSPPSEFASGTVTPITEQPTIPASTPYQRPTLFTQQTGRPVTSMFSIISHPTMRGADPGSPTSSSPTTPHLPPQQQHIDLRAEILDGLAELIDELDQSDDFIAGYALDHIHPSETIFTYATSPTVQRFLLKAAAKRKFTLIQAEGYPNYSTLTHAAITGNRGEEDEMDVETFEKPLIQAGVRVIVIPDSNIFAMISRATKVVLSADAVFSNGSFIAPSGTKLITKAAHFHHVPVLVLAATYKLSVVYPFNSDEYIEDGDLDSVVDATDAELRKGVKGLRNPLTEVVSGNEVDLFVTNTGGVAGEGVGRLVVGLYWDEDRDLL